MFDPFGWRRFLIFILGMVLPLCVPACASQRAGADTEAVAVSVSGDAPQISAISASVGPGDTLVATGEGLSGAHLVVEAGGDEFVVEPVRRDDQKLIAVMPEGIGLGVLRVWPESVAGRGDGVRVNEPQAWWAWPCRVDPEAPDVLRVFGRHLQVQGVGTARAVLMSADGQELSAECKAISAFELWVTPPVGLSPGRYELKVHNGTGGDGGWSRPIGIELAGSAALAAHTVQIEADAMPEGAVSDVINRTVRELQQRGGGTVELGAGEYVLEGPIVIQAGPAVRLRGAGVGRWDAGAGRLVDAESEASVLRYPEGTRGLVMVDIEARGSGLSRLALVCESDVPNSAVRMRGRDMTVKDCLIVRTREDTATAGVHSAYVGAANHVIESCTIYGVSSCVRVGRGCDYVRITACKLRGGFTQGRATSSNAVVNQGGNQMVMEHCDVRGIDRTRGRVLARTCLLYHSSIRNTYLANNYSKDVGPHPSVPGVDGNTGEQYLFHYRGAEGGRFDVASAEGSAVVLEGDVPGRVDGSGDWVVYVLSGRGAGQWRTVVRRNGDALTVDRPWRVSPGAGSVVVVQQAFRHNVVYGNRVDGPSDPGEGMKVVGAYLYQLAFENVVSGNTFSDVAVGVAIACDVDRPSAWNLIEGNTVQNVHGDAGGTALMPMFFNEHARGLQPGQRAGIEGWIGLGNTFRLNVCEGAPAAAAVGWLRGEGQGAPGYRIGADKGLVMTVIERNRFEGVGRGVLLSTPSVWTVVRGNTLTGDAAGEPVESHHRTVVEPLVLP